MICDLDVVATRPTIYPFQRLRLTYNSAALSAPKAPEIKAFSRFPTSRDVSETSQYVIDVCKSLTYYACMIFVESPVFTRQVAELLNDEDYSDLQQFLVSQPDAGDVIQGTGGLLKVRWVTAGKGKRGAHA